MSFRLNLDSDQLQHLTLHEPICVAPSTLVRDVIAKMKDAKHGSVLVCDDEKLVGIFTERDVLKIMAGDANFEIAVSEVMTREPTTMAPTASVTEAISSMAAGGYRRIPVVDDHGSVSGMLMVEQILHHLVEHFPQYIYNLPPTPHHKLREREGA